MTLRLPFFFWLAAMPILSGSLPASESAPGSNAVAPVVFGFQQIPTDSANAPRIAGTVLLGELGCVNCHRPSKSPSAIDAKSGPDLRQAQSYKAGYLESWIAAPNHVKPGTTMPDLLAAIPQAERDQTAADLAAYIRSLRPIHENSTDFGAPNSLDGAELYHSIGCVACHDPVASNKSAPAASAPIQVTQESVPLGRLADKYSRETLGEFLMNPLSRRPSARMPSLNLSPTEAGVLAAWLLEKGPKSGAPVEAPRHQGNSAAGAIHFQTLKCAACHQVSETASNLASARPLADLRWDSPRSCVGAKPAAGIPHYHLSSRQLASLRAATLSPPAPLNNRESMTAHVLAMGCTACHVRDGMGGPEPGRAACFTGIGDDLGDEGRFPPTLNRVGYKLVPQALTDTIARGTHLRPYLKTRMPAFGVAVAGPLSEGLATCDVPKDLANLNQKGRNEAGRKLLGTTGLSCIACHGVNGHKSLGMSAIDLTQTIGRLRPEWLVDFLKNPAEFTPGTRMPSFWSDTKRDKMVGDVDAIRVYLLESDQARLPEGLKNNQTYELIPSQRPIIFRSFISGAGTQGIAIGFPEGLNVAFDAESSNWALAWKGRFLDAEGTWFDRVNPPADPLGTDILAFGSGPPLARLKDAKQAWPDSAPRTREVRYLGYRLDSRGYPTFRYKFDGVEVTDRMEPSRDGRSLTREISWPAGIRDVWARLAVAPSIESLDVGNCRIGGKWNVSIPAPAADRLMIRSAADGKNREAILAPSSAPELNRIQYRIQW